jgi:hypothetical protein
MVMRKVEQLGARSVGCPDVALQHNQTLTFAVPYRSFGAGSHDGPMPMVLLASKSVAQHGSNGWELPAD